MIPAYAVLLHTQTDADDVLNGYAVFLGRGIESSEALNEKVGSSLANIIVSILQSAEYEDFVATPILLGDSVKQDRFLYPPAPAEREWVISKVPLTATGRNDVAHAATWLQLHQHLFADENFQGLLGRLAKEFPAKAMAAALSARTYPLTEESDGAEAQSALSNHNSPKMVDSRAKALLGRLSETRLGALFDLAWIANSCGLRFKSPGHALASYFNTPRTSRFSPSPKFDPVFYAQEFADDLNDDTDPFSHFIANVQDGGFRPSLIIDPQHLARGAHRLNNRLESFCDFLDGMDVTSFHPLVDIAYIRSQPNCGAMSPLDILTAVSREDQPLTFSPHPLFDLSFYRDQVDLTCQNELVDYLRNKRNSTKTHTLVSPEFLYSQGLRASHYSSLLESYITSWPQQQFSPSLFVAPAHLNHSMVFAGLPVRDEPLSELIRRDLDGKDWLHPEVDARFLAAAFRNLGTSTSTTALLGAALQMSPVAACDNPWLSVIIVTYNKPAYTALSILAALNALRTTPHEIIVVENGGELHHHEELLRIFAPHPSVRFIKLAQNRYFGEGNNIGLDQVSGSYVLFLNNDCFLTPDFGETLELICEGSSEAVDAVGGALLYPNGNIQELGGTIQEDGNPIQNLKHLSGAFLDDMHGLKKVDYVSAACLCVSRRSLDRVAGFDPLYEPFYFEDTDFCRRLSQAGFVLHVSPRLRAIHIENASTRDFLGEGFNALVQRNRERFARRWIKNRGADTYVRRPQRASDKTRRALIYSPFDIRPGGGEAYLLNAARTLSQTHRTVLALPQRVSHARIEFACHALGIEPFPFDVTTLAEAMSHNPEFDVTFVMGNEIVPPIAPLGRRNFYHLQFPFPWRDVGAFDFTRVSAYDAVIVNSKFTADWTAKRFKQVGLGGRTPPVHIIAPPVRALPFATRSPVAGRPLRLANVGRLFVGGHSKRQDIFVEIVAQLRAAKVDVTGVMIGSPTEDDEAKLFYAKVAERAKAVGIEMQGECSRADIARTLQQADIYLHCCGYRVDASLAPEKVEHFGIAVVEAITAGAYPIVVDSGGPAEIIRASGVGAGFDTINQAIALIKDFKINPKSTAPAMAWAASVSEARFGERLLALVRSYDVVEQEKRSA